MFHSLLFTTAAAAKKPNISHSIFALFIRFRSEFWTGTVHSIKDTSTDVRGDVLDSQSISFALKNSNKEVFILTILLRFSPNSLFRRNCTSVLAKQYILSYTYLTMAEKQS